ncbi:MAG: Putative helicase [uncultured Nocardioidaceae bacterium]|uniref:Helicase n=1 Tax=uncultured Nocardioidaceae bacterium TaxID=253824 RepID=A0A6J4NBZ8_9ACTN|nr:MAG: Putative helicase [uncultured Nocardioidaceae bacterium]
MGESCTVRTDPLHALETLAGAPEREGRLVHLELRPAREAGTGTWPDWVAPPVREALAAAGLQRPWHHQVLAAEHAHAGRHVVVATGTASGKSLAYLAPALTELAAAVPAASALHRRLDRGPTVLYLSPTKALAHDQLRAVCALAGAYVPGLRAAAVDGDNSPEERSWARDHATYVVSNPDMLHRSLLPAHRRWGSFWSGLRYVVVDECHHYRGVFGSHVAQVLRRLRRVAAEHGAAPTFVLASATVSEPELAARRLTGLDVVAVTEDASPRGTTAVALWEPPLTDSRGEHGAPVRRSVTAETADLVADLVSCDVRTLAFVRSRRGAESVAMSAKRLLGEVDPALAEQVAAYRGGYLPEERRELEAAFKGGRLTALAATSALELGIDIEGLDAVVSAGYPGTRAALWQQFGRAGRAQQSAVGVLVARDDPLDAYLVRHPQALLGSPVEATVLDPDNPHVLGPHLCAAAQELPLTEADLELFGSQTAGALDALEAAALLRRRRAGWFWTRRDRASDLVDIRSSGGRAVQVVHRGTGRLLGTVDAASAHHAVHTGAVYVHQGETHLVHWFDPDEAIAEVEPAQVDYTTTAREVTDICVVEQQRSCAWGEAELSTGQVSVTSQVVSYLRRRLGSAEVLGEHPLDLPERQLVTAGVWWTLSAEQVRASGIAASDLGGAAHAAEHASIGLLPLFATCDRWDVGGVSTVMHPDTGRLTVFVHDGHPGGAGFADRGYRAAARWLHTTRDAIAGCPCEDGCPSCVQSPKCGNGNFPLHKAGAVRLLDALLSGAPAADHLPGADQDSAAPVGHASDAGVLERSYVLH